MLVKKRNICNSYEEYILVKMRNIYDSYHDE